VRVGAWLPAPTSFARVAVRRYQGTSGAAHLLPLRVDLPVLDLQGVVSGRRTSGAVEAWGQGRVGTGVAGGGGGSRGASSGGWGMRVRSKLLVYICTPSVPNYKSL
jgi:hypothetical protein